MTTNKICAILSTQGERKYIHRGDGMKFISIDATLPPEEIHKLLMQKIKLLKKNKKK